MLGAQAACIRQEEVRAALNLPNNLTGCQALVFTDADASRLRSDNRQFPFNFQIRRDLCRPQLSLPLFDGFAREQRVQQARAASDDARFNVRARELASQQM